MPNRIFLLRFDGISGEFGRAMVRILNRLRLVHVRRDRSKELHMSPKSTKKLLLGMYRTQIRPSEHNIIAISAQCLISQDIRTVDTASDWLIVNMGTVV